MTYAITLFFDAHAEATVRDVWHAVRGATGSAALLDMDLDPHLTLAIYEAGEEDVLRGALSALDQGVVELVLVDVDAFPGDEGVLFLSPRADVSLQELHRAWHALAPGSATLYRPGSWVPHVTVGYALPAAVRPAGIAAARPFLPVHGCIESVGLLEVAPHAARPARELVREPLGRA